MAKAPTTALKILPLCDGTLSSSEIAEKVNCGHNYVRRVAAKYGKPLFPGRTAERNARWKGGISVDLDGYAQARIVGKTPSRPTRTTRRVYYHRKLMAEKIGRPLNNQEVVDHIDGLTLHNDISNLRLFACNADHLRATIQGKAHRISKAGLENIYAQKKGHHLTPVDTYRQMKEAGDVRLRAILLALLKFDINSPHLSGTHQWLEKAQISDFSHPNLKRELERLYRKYA